MKRRIEVKESFTAELTCAFRVVSYYEKNPYLKSDDYVATKIIPPSKRLLVRNPLFKKLVASKAGPGIYEYVICRTKYIDAVFQKLDDSFTQILIFGAGFDTRALRFQEKLKKATVFELDAPITQNAKIEQYNKMHLAIPRNLKFIAIDFEKETLNQKLREAGFQANQRSLFLLEALIMYLDAPSVDSTFSIISTYAGTGSLIVFDYAYASAIREESDYYGEKVDLKRAAKVGEPWKFGIEEGQLESFLAKYSFELVDQSDAQELEKRFLTDQNGKQYGRVNAAQCLVTARKI
jgi:methyltransferase (TIGR00027 family)